jgi:hypothetical protein
LKTLHYLQQFSASPGPYSGFPLPQPWI